MIPLPIILIYHLHNSNTINTAMKNSIVVCLCFNKKTTQTKEITQKYIICIQTCFDKKRAEQHTLFMFATASNNI